MSAEPPPANSNGGYNPDDWTNPNAPVDQQYLAQNYLQFPAAQGAETMGDVTVAGAFTAQNPASFSETATFNNGINVALVGVTFPDTTTQTTAFIEANYAQLNTDNTFLSPYIQKFASGVTFGDDTTQTTAFIEANYAQLNTDNIFLAPYQNTFQQNNSTTATTAPIKITNTANSDNASLYIDPAPSVDLTLYSAQSSGGLTVRNPTASFTLNPVTITTGVVGARSLNPIDMNGKALYGLENVYTDANDLNLIDYAGDALLTLSNSTGSICYTGLSMNNNRLSGLNIISSYGTGMTITDGSNSSMLLLTNGGHTSYENINMNYNQLSNVNQISFGGNNCSIQNSNSINQNTLNIINNSPYVNNGTINFQMLNSFSNPFNPLSITSTGVLYGTNINMQNLNINNCASINPSLNNYVTTTTPPNGDNSTKLATTAFVIANQPSLTNFAQLTTSTPQTFTGQINFSAATKYNGNQVATINQLPYNISSTISNYTLLSPTNITLNSGFSQISTYYPSTGQAIFLNYPINITITAGVAANDPLCYLQFSVAPFPSYPPVATSGQITTTSNTGAVNLAGYSWIQIGNPILQINMPYNVGIGNTLTFTLASLGNITV